MKKSLRKLIPTFVMLVITAALIGTSTFAWFSMNNKVTVSGMSVQTKVSSNIQIAAFDASDGTYKGNQENLYMNSLSQTRAGTLEPVSTTNAVDFFYHATNEHVLGNGNVDNTTFVAYNEDTALDNGTAAKDNYDNEFVANYGISGEITTSNVVYGYIDYEFFLKANSTADNQVLKMTQCNLRYNGGAVVEEKAFRVAVFSADSAKETGTTDLGTLKTILTPDSAANYTSGKAWTSISARGDVTYNTAAVIDADIDAGAIKYYKIVVRLWLEGDDDTCNNTTFSTKTGNWTLDLGFELAANSTNAVVNVGTYGATATGATATAVATGMGACTYKWFDSSDTDLSTTTATYTLTGSAGDSKNVYCKVTNANGDEFTTNTVTVTVPTP